jgi:hypothetical protein
MASAVLARSDEMSMTAAEQQASSIAERFGITPGATADIMLGAQPDGPCVRQIETVSVSAGWLKFTFKKRDEDKCNHGGYSIAYLIETHGISA